MRPHTHVHAHAPGLTVEFMHMLADMQHAGAHTCTHAHVRVQTHARFQRFRTCARMHACICICERLPPAVAACMPKHQCLPSTDVRGACTGCICAEPCGQVAADSAATFCQHIHGWLAMDVVCLEDRPAVILRQVQGLECWGSSGLYRSNWQQALRSLIGPDFQV